MTALLAVMQMPRHTERLEIRRRTLSQNQETFWSENLLEN